MLAFCEGGQNVDVTAESVRVTAAPRPVGGAGPGAARAAGTVAVTSWVIAAVSIGVLIAARPPVTADLWFFVVDVTVAAVYGTVAGVTLSRRPGPVPWILAVTAVGGAVAAFSYAWTGLAGRRPGLPGLSWIDPLQGITWVPGTLALFLVIPWLIRDHPLGQARWGVVAGAAVTAAFTFSRIVDYDEYFEVFIAAMVAVGGAAAAEAAWRWRRGPVEERVGLGWLALGTTVMAVSFAPLALPATGLPFWFTPVLHIAAQALFPAAILVSVLRQRMWGLDLPVSRAVVAGTLTVALAAAYVAVAALVSGIVPGEGIAQWVAAAVVVIAVQPSRWWIEQRVRRLVHGTGADPDRAFRRVGAHFGRAADPEDLLTGLVGSVGEALRLESVALVVDGATVASSGTPTSEPVDSPVMHRGEEVARLAVTTPPGEAMSARDQRHLGELATVVGAGVALTRAARDLDDARRRLTSVRLEERRVIRRELHDGLGPSLAGIRLGLQGARNLVERDPDRAAALLTALQDELDGRVEDVRQLSRHLLPPVLDELGLVAAVEELAARWSASGLDVVVRVTGEPPDPLPAPAAGAAYGIIAEAVTNVRRHSGSSRCAVTIQVTNDHLVVRVADGGVGIGSRATGSAGVGMRSMRERAEEQGGSLTVTDAVPHGTIVEARLHLEVR